MLNYGIQKLKLYYNRAKLTKIYNEKKSFTDPEVIKQSQKLDKVINKINKYKNK